MIGPEFAAQIDETLPDQTVINSIIQVQRWNPTAAVQDEPDPRYNRTHHRPLGRAWETPGYGWVAAPLRLDNEVDDWSDEINRSHRYFATLADACMFLYGYATGAGAQRLASDPRWAIVRQTPQ